LCDLVIADRTFSSIDDIVCHFPLGFILAYVYKLLLFPNSNNVDNFLNCERPKIIINDSQDTIVKDFASLKTGLAKSIIKSLSKKKNFSAIETDNILTVIFSPKEKDDFIQALIQIAKFISDIEKVEKKNHSNKPQNQFTNLLLQKNKQVNTKYTNLSQEYSSKVSSDNIEVHLETNYDSRNENEYYNNVTREIENAFEEFECAGDSLLTIKKFHINPFKTRNLIENLFTNLFIWGCSNSDEQNLEGLMSHYEIQNKFQTLAQRFESIIKNTSENKKLPISKSLDIFHKRMMKLGKEFSRLLFIDSFGNNGETIINRIGDSTNSKSNMNIEVFFNKFHKVGSLIPVSCGHNGNMSEGELLIFIQELKRFKFIE
jgi:hypothetical protein